MSGLPPPQPPQPQRWRVHVTAARTLATEQRASDARFAFVTRVSWSDGTMSVVSHTHEDLYAWHLKLLDLFPDEAGASGRPRVIPPLPGKKILSFRGIGRASRDAAARALAERRLPEIAAYTAALALLPPAISQSPHARTLFGYPESQSAPPAAGDPAQQPPPGPASPSSPILRSMSSPSSLSPASPAVLREPLPPSLPAADPGPAVLAGFLIVCTGRSWKQRHCVLTAEGHLLLFRTVRTEHNRIPPVEDIALDRSVAMLKPPFPTDLAWPHGVDQECCLVLQTPRIACQLAAKTLHEALEWIAGIAPHLARAAPQEEARPSGFARTFSLRASSSARAERGQKRSQAQEQAPQPLSVQQGQQGQQEQQAQQAPQHYQPIPHQRVVRLESVSSRSSASSLEEHLSTSPSFSKTLLAEQQQQHDRRSARGRGSPSVTPQSTPLGVRRDAAPLARPHTPTSPKRTAWAPEELPRHEAAAVPALDREAEIEPEPEPEPGPGEATAGREEAALALAPTAPHQPSTLRRSASAGSWGGGRGGAGEEELSFAKDKKDEDKQ
jgi:hypothetical protein